MIESFRDKRTAAIFAGRHIKGVHSRLQERAREKLKLLDKARTLKDLRVPPGNKLEVLSGDRKEQMSIRVNDQWRICFMWHENNAWQAELVDYH
jgi:proteic killer suppression protein